MRYAPRILLALALLALLPQMSLAGDPEIAYSAGCGGNINCIWVMDADGSNKRAVYQGEKFGPSGLWPSWSPDGGSLAFAYFSALYRIDLDQMTVYPDGQLLAAREGWLSDGRAYQSIGDAAWSPLGHEIAVRTLNPSAICVIDESGGTLEAIYTAPEGSHLATSPAWNSDGTRIAVFEESNTTQLIIINRQTGMVVEPRFDVDGQMPDWARRDDRIAFNRMAGPHFRDTWVYTVRLADGEVSPVVKGRWPSWSPDDSQIVFTDTKGKLKRYTFFTEEVETLGEGSSADWRRVTAVCGDGTCSGAETSCTCDIDCGAPPAREEVSLGECADGIDNDCDQAIDCDDSDCSAAENCQPTCDNGGEKGRKKCNDGIDNDGDGCIDAADPDCW